MSATRDGRPLRERYDADGYAIIEDAVSCATIDAHIAHLDELDRCNPLLARRTTRSIRDGIAAARIRHRLIQGAPSTAELQLSPVLKAALNDILEDDPVPLFSTLFRVSPMAGRAGRSPTFTPHLHNTEFDTKPPDRFALVWLALENIDPAAGPMWVATASHLKWRGFPRRLEHMIGCENPELMRMLENLHHVSTTIEIWSELMESLSSAARTLLAREQPSETITPEPIVVRKGTALILHPDLLHGTLPPRTANAPLSRLSSNIRYIGKTCRVWNYAETIGLAPDRRGLEITKRFFDTPHGSMLEDFFGERYARLR